MPVTVRLLLVRHGSHAEVGRVLSGRSEIMLDARGVREAGALAMRLAGLPLAGIHSSPRRRARETAAPLASRTGRPVEVVAALDEIDFGAFAGRCFAELEADRDWHRWNAERDTFRCPAGETMAEAVGRAERHLLSLADRAGPVVLVTHCDMIRGVVARLLGLPWAAMFALPCDPGSLTELMMEGGTLRLVTLNERP